MTHQTLAHAARWLAGRDRDLAVLLAEDGVPPLWSRRPGFSTLVRIILEQQVSLVSAKAMAARLTRRLGSFTPSRFLDAGVSRLRSLGVTRQKARYLVDLAEAVQGRTLDLKGLSDQSDAEVTAALVSLPGIGPWTAEVYLLMALGRSDVWPTGDVALVTATQKVKELGAPPSREELARIAAAWSPFRSVAARMLWQHYLKGLPGR